MTCFCVRPLRREHTTRGVTDVELAGTTVTLRHALHRKRHLVPESEGGAAGEEDGFGFGLGLLEEPEEGVVLHADLPEHLAAVPAAHEELQGVLVRTLGAGRPWRSG